MAKLLGGKSVPDPWGHILGADSSIIVYDNANFRTRSKFVTNLRLLLVGRNAAPHNNVPLIGAKLTFWIDSSSRFSRQAQTETWGV